VTRVTNYDDERHSLRRYLPGPRARLRRGSASEIENVSSTEKRCGGLPACWRAGEWPSIRETYSLAFSVRRVPASQTLKREIVSSLVQADA